MVKTLTRQEKAEERTRQRTKQILEAAAKVFARRGFHDSTTKEIAAEAGVAEGTIYNYFRSKRDLLIAMVARLASESLLLVMERADTLDARALLTEILRDRLALFDRNREIVQVVIHELIVDAELRRRYLDEVVAPIAQQMIVYFRKRVAAGTFRPFDLRVIPPAMVGATFMAGLVTAGDLGALAPGVPSPKREEVISELVEFFLHGIEVGKEQGQKG